MTNYILHFKGRENRAIGNFYHYRFEINCNSDQEFTDALYSKYEHISPLEFYINGVSNDYFSVLKTHITEIK